jgi:ABC-type antimicrobial peptide transport system permease subunit
LLKGTVGAVILLLFVRAVVLPERYIVIVGGVALGVAVFSAVAAVATLVPALRALRIDVSRALRTD